MEPTRREIHTLRESSTHSRDKQRSTFAGKRIIQELPARGGEADTYVIEEDGQKRFLKVYRKGIIPKLEALRRIKEISQQNRDHLVTIFEIGRDTETGRYFEITEYLEHGNLLNHLPMLREQLETVIDQIAKSLDVLHRNGIVHRDLKPTNVMVRSLDPLNLVLIDFGIASTLSHDFSKIYTTSFKGTYAYMAPEELSGYFGKEIDWWHLGIIIYEIILGENPFARLSHQVIIHRLTTQGVKIPAHIPGKYQRLLKGLLTRNYKKRWGYDEIVQWLKGLDVPVFYEEYETEPYMATEKEWIEAGFSPKSKWVEIGKSLGLSPKETGGFVDFDFSVYEVREWVEAGIRSGKRAKRWKDMGFSPEEASVFEQAGLTPGHAKQLLERGITAFHIYRLIEQGISGEVLFNAMCEQIEYFLLQGFSIDDARKFKAAGLTPQEAKKWHTEGFSPREAIVWQGLGYSTEKAVQKKREGITLETLVKRTCKMTMDELEKWLKLGFHPEESARWKKLGFTPDEAFQWKNVLGTPEEAKKWKKEKFTPIEAQRWRNAGLSVSEASRWKRAGFSATDALYWKQYGYNFRSAKLWVNAGFSIQHAFELRQSGISPAQAWLRRYIPSRVVYTPLSQAWGLFVLSLFINFLIAMSIYNMVLQNDGHVWGMKVYVQAQNFLPLPKIAVSPPSLDNRLVLLGSFGLSILLSIRTFTTKFWIPWLHFLPGY